MKKVLITGISGFVGSYLGQLLLEKGFEIVGTYLTDESKDSLPNKEKYTLHKLNLIDEKSTWELIEKEQPDQIYHLAALPATRDSFDNPKETFINNVSSQISILEAVKKTGLKNTKILIVSSAEVYGLVSKDNLPINEEVPFNPTNPYAVSKLTQDMLGLQYFLSDQLKIIRVRPFNHVGPRQSPQFAVSAFAKKIAEIEKGKEKIMKVGNLDSSRDFTDVRDMVKAYVLALDLGKEGDVYNLGSGKSYKISEILDMYISMSRVKITVEKDRSLIRRSDDPQLLCDSSKFRKLTGWKPEIPIEKTLKDTLEYWREVI